MEGAARARKQADMENGAALSVQQGREPQKPQSPSPADHQWPHAAGTQRTHVFRWSGRGTKTFSTQRLTPTSSSRPTTTSSSERPGWPTRATTPAWPKTSSLAAKAPRRRCSCMVSDAAVVAPVSLSGALTTWRG